MHFLNALSFRPTEFVGQDIPAYAILSHTWDDKEVLVSDLAASAVEKYKSGVYIMYVQYIKFLPRT